MAKKTETKVNTKAAEAKSSRTTKPASLTGDHYTLAQVAVEAIHFATEDEMLKTKKSTIADHFMSAATMYITEKPTGEEMPKDHPFLVACKEQETFSKSAAAGENQWDTIPRVWTQLKSNIKQAYNNGIDINDYDSENSVREELNKRRKEAKEKGENNQESEALTDLAETASQPLSQRVFAIAQMCKDLTEAQEQDVLRILDDAIENITVMKELTSELQAAVA